MRIKQFIFLWILGITFQLFAGFPVYIDLDIGETVTPEGFPSVRLIDKQVTVLDKSIQRIGSSDVTLDVDDQTVVVPVGLEHPDVIVDETRIGVEVISDYVTRIERFNKRFRLFKDARIRLSKATEPLMPAGSHAYPLDTPWNSGFRNQGWLANCYLIDVLQGDKPKSTDRYHDGWDFGVWEGQLVRSVCTGEVVNPDDYPDLIENGLVYNKNNSHDQ
jgi:hypothetical protein